MKDLTKLTNKAFLQILKFNNEYNTAIATSNEWSEVVDVIDQLNIKYTDVQMSYVKSKQWD